MGLFSKSKSSSSTTNNNQRTSTVVDGSQTLAEGAEARSVSPVGNNNRGTANQEGLVNLNAGGDVSLRADNNSRDYGLGDFSNVRGDVSLQVESLDADVALAALAANTTGQSRALDSVDRANQLAALGTLGALDTVDKTVAGAFATTDRTVDRALDSIDTDRARSADSVDLALRALSTATLEAQNTARDQVERVTVSASETTKNALDKLAEQRAPDGANYTKLLITAVIAGALAWVFTRRKAS
jgi:hypothetical protein